jgi:NTE family protein
VDDDTPPIRIGLALGGGAVRGAAHIGVLDVLDRAGLPPAIITGTSAGALVGALYASGMSPAEIA